MLSFYSANSMRQQSKGRHVTLLGQFYSANSMRQQSKGRHVTLLGTVLWPQDHIFLP